MRRTGSVVCRGGEADWGNLGSDLEFSSTEEEAKEEGRLDCGT